MSRICASKSQSGSPGSHKEINTIDSLARQAFKPNCISIPVFIILILLIIAHYILSIYNFLPISVDHLPIAIDLTRFFTSLTAIIYIACKIFSAYGSRELIITFFKNHPIQLFVSIIACGATTAFFLPLILNLFKFIGETDKLTTALLASTGGVIAVFTLIKTHQKNQTDEATLEHNKAVHAQQIKDRNYDIGRQISERKEQKEQFDRNFNLQSSKNKQDHIHQVHTERRSRYTKAVEQLGNENAAIRFGGIYTLVGLVDEWLADDVLNPEEGQKEGQKEGQVIINNLCAYIRSPFPSAEKIDEYKAYKKFEELKEKESKYLLNVVDSSELKALCERFPNPQDYKKPKDIATAQATFNEEQDVRRAIFVEMSKRSSNIIEKNGKVIKTVPGTWSDFNFDFSRAPIFYPLNDLTIEQGNFSGTKVYIDADFSEVTFPHNADFSEARFTHNANFSETRFTYGVDFRGARFTITPNFSEATFTSIARFDRATFTRDVNFSKATFTCDVSFNGATFTRDANFRGATFTHSATFTRTRFTHSATFSGATFTPSATFSGATFTRDANFGGATFKRRVNFSEARFTHDANFGGATFTGIVDFTKAKFAHDANFGGATFISRAHFNKATFTYNANFGGATFIHHAHFNKATFTYNANFRRTTFENFNPTFATKLEQAQFSASSNPQDYKFSPLTPDKKTIKLRTATLLGKTFEIPRGTVLFDPKSLDKKQESILA